MAEIRISPKFQDMVIKEATKRLDKAAAHVQNNAKIMLKRPRRGSVGDYRDKLGAGEPPHTDSGHLSQSVWRRTAEDRPLVRQVGTSMFYGAVQEFGAPGAGPNGQSIAQPVAKHGRYMAIPWSEEAYRHSANGGSARTFQPRTGKLTRIPLKRVNGFLLVSSPEKPRMGSRSTIHYIFLTKVTIQKHPWLAPAFEQSKSGIKAIFEGAA